MSDRTRERLCESMIWNALPPITAPTTRLAFPRFLSRSGWWPRRLLLSVAERRDANG
jgi:hypothetical protein